MKPILIAIVAFLASLGAVSGVVALRERDSILAHEAADEAAKHTSPARPTATEAPAPDPVPAEAEPIPAEAEAHTEDLSASETPFRRPTMRHRQPTPL